MQIPQDTIEKCREGGPDGYVLAAGDMVPPATPLENLQAMMHVVKDSSIGVEPR